MQVLALVAARMGSNRLKGKVLKKLAGIPSLVHIFNILKEVKNLDDFAVVTTVLSEDDKIGELCKRYNVKCIRGSVYDVLERFRIAVEKYKPKHICRVTGDNPIMDPEIIERIISEHISGYYDYTSNKIKRTYPIGMDTELLKYEVLEKIWRTTDDRDDHEHVTLFIRRKPKLFKICNVKKNGQSLAHIRLSIDTEEDYRLVKNIYDNLYNGFPIKLGDIIEYLDANPALLKINYEVKQKKIKNKIY